MYLGFGFGFGSHLPLLPIRFHVGFTAGSQQHPFFLGIGILRYGFYVLCDWSIRLVCRLYPGCILSGPSLRTLTPFSFTPALLYASPPPPLSPPFYLLSPPITPVTTICLSASPWSIMHTHIPHASPHISHPDYPTRCIVHTRTYMSRPPPYPYLVSVLRSSCMYVVVVALRLLIPPLSLSSVPLRHHLVPAGTPGSSDSSCSALKLKLRAVQPHPGRVRYIREMRFRCLEAPQLRLRHGLRFQLGGTGCGCGRPH